MVRFMQPYLLLLYGALTGALVTAIYLTDLFSFVFPMRLLPAQIDSGWGSLIGAGISGSAAVLLFWVQRYVDKKDRSLQGRKADQLKAHLARTHLERVVELFRHEDVIKDLAGWLERPNFQYLAKSTKELQFAFIRIRVSAGHIPNLLERASNYLYEVAVEEDGFADYRKQYHKIAIELSRRSEEAREVIAEIEDLSSKDAKKWAEIDIQEGSINIATLLMMMDTVKFELESLSYIDELISKDLKD